MSLRFPPTMPWLTALAPTAEGRQLVAASSGDPIARATIRLGRDAVQWAVEVGHEVALRVSHDATGVVAEGCFDILRMGTEATTLQMLLALSGDELAGAAPRESLAGVPDFIRQHVRLDDMLRGIHLGHSVLAAAFLAACSRLCDPEQRAEQMRVLSERTFDFFNAYSGEMAAFYLDEERRRAQAPAVERLALVDEILRGSGPAAAAVSHRLRYSFAAAHVALVVWSSARTIDAGAADVHRAARDLLCGVDCEQQLVVEPDPAIAWAWITPKPGEDWRKHLAAGHLPPGVHAVHSGKAVGVSGFRSSHADAVAAFELVARRPVPPAVTDHRDVDLLSLLLSDRAKALRFARNELGALAEESPSMADLRHTVAAYLDSGGSPQAVGERLGISRNTVTYRVRRAEEIRGRAVRSRQTHLRVALAVYEETIRAKG